MYKYTTNTTYVYYHRQYIAQNLHHILHTQSNISLFLVLKMHPVRFQLPTFANSRSSSIEKENVDTTQNQYRTKTIAYLR